MLLIITVSILASFCVWTKSLMCKDAVNRDSTCQSIFRRLYTAKKIEDFIFLSAVWTTCHPVRTPIGPLFHSSGRRVHPDRTPDRPASSVRTTYLFRLDPYTVSRSFCSSLHPSGHLSSPSGRISVLEQSQVLSKFQ
jgi:hypothetical protein